MFELFDPKDDTRITRGILPHWYQPGVTCFITIRTDDSIPKVVSELWYRRLNDWLLRHGIPPNATDRRDRLLALPIATRHEYHE